MVDPRRRRRGSPCTTAGDPARDQGTDAVTVAGVTEAPEGIRADPEMLTVYACPETRFVKTVDEREPETVTG